MPVRSVLLRGMAILFLFNPLLHPLCSCTELRVKFILERSNIMCKSILFSLLTVSGSCLSAGSAFACGHGAGCASAAACAPSCAAPANAAPADMVPADPHAGMQMNRGTPYQSFSYEAGSAPRLMSAPAYRPNRQPSFYDTVRGDRKVRGLSN